MPVAGSTYWNTVHGLYGEEASQDEEGMQTTENKMISIGHPISMDDDEFMVQLEELEKAANSDSPNIKQIVSNLVPTYVPKD